MACICAGCIKNCVTNVKVSRPNSTVLVLPVAGTKQQIKSLRQEQDLVSSLLHVVLFVRNILV